MHDHWIASRNDVMGVYGYRRTRRCVQSSVTAGTHCFLIESVVQMSPLFGEVAEDCESGTVSVGVFCRSVASVQANGRPPGRTILNIVMSYRPRGDNYRILSGAERLPESDCDGHMAATAGRDGVSDRRRIVRMQID